MTRLRRIAISDRIFFVTTNIGRNRAALGAAERDILLQVIAERRDQGAFWLYAYCVMPDHLHLMLGPRNRDLVASIREIKSVSGARIVHGRGEVGSLWQPKYFDNIMRRVRDFWAKLEYIHNNPVAAGLAADPCDWKWSSYAGTSDRSALPIAVDIPDLPQDLDALLWPAPWK